MSRSPEPASHLCAGAAQPHSQSLHSDLLLFLYVVGRRAWRASELPPVGLREHVTLGTQRGALGLDYPGGGTRSHAPCTCTWANVREDARASSKPYPRGRARPVPDTHGLAHTCCHLAASQASLAPRGRRCGLRGVRRVLVVGRGVAGVAQAEKVPPSPRVVCMGTCSVSGAAPGPVAMHAAWVDSMCRLVPDTWGVSVGCFWVRRACGW